MTSSIFKWISSSPWKACPWGPSYWFPPETTRSAARKTTSMETTELVAAIKSRGHRLSRPHENWEMILDLVMLWPAALLPFSPHGGIFCRLPRVNSLFLSMTPWQPSECRLLGWCRQVTWPRWSKARHLAALGGVDLEENCRLVLAGQQRTNVIWTSINWNSDVRRERAE